MSQINLLLDTVIASFLVTGSVSWLYYSDRLIEFPLGLFGIGIATVILPTLSKLHVNAEPKQFQATVDWGVRFVIWLGIPASFGLSALAPIIISVLFGHGEFMASGDNVNKVSMGVTAYAVGLLSFMLIKVLAPAFYARQNTKTPAKIGIVAMTLNMAFNVALAPMLGYLGLALATSLSATCNALLLYYFLNKQEVYGISRNTVWFFIKCLFASIVMFFVVKDLESMFIWQSVPFLHQVLVLTGLIVAAIVLYFALLLLMGIRFNQIKNIN